MNLMPSARDRLDADLENLERMLPIWREKLRHEAQFWPQFDILSREILARTDSQDRQYAQGRIDAMLTKHAPLQFDA